MQRALAEGHPVLVLGDLPAVLPIPPGWSALRVRCEAGARPLAPLREAAARALQWMGEDHALDAVGVARGSAKAEALARALNRLAAKNPAGCALLLDDVNRADQETLALLRRWLSLPGSLRMPVVLGFTDEVRTPEAQALFDTARELGAVEVSAVEEPAPAAPQEDWGASLQRLGPEELMTVRAAAVLGARCDVHELAAVREQSVVHTLEVLQRARDLGAPIDDDGRDGVTLPEGLMRLLRGSVLPSLARAWQQRAAARRGGAGASAPPMMTARAVAGSPGARVVLNEAADGAVAPESAVRREAPQSRRKRVESDGTVGDPVPDDDEGEGEPRG